jgi:hypothetical protein
MIINFILITFKIILWSPNYCFNPFYFNLMPFIIRVNTQGMLFLILNLFYHFAKNLFEQSIFLRFPNFNDSIHHFNYHYYHFLIPFIVLVIGFHLYGFINSILFFP